MIYAEASYFGGYHFQHIVAWGEYNRIKRIRAEMAKLVCH